MNIYQLWIKENRIEKDNISIGNLVQLFSAVKEPVKVLEFTLQLLSTSDQFKDCQVFEELWPKVIEPLLIDPIHSKNLQIMEYCRLLLEKVVMNACKCALSHKFTSKTKTLKKLLKRLESELENQDLKQVVEDVLLNVATTYMSLFCEAIESSSKKSTSRISCWVLLSRLLKRDGIPVYILLESRLFGMIVESAWKDTHPLGVKTSLSVLTILLPHLSQSIKGYYESFFKILINVLRWESMFLELAGEDDYAVMAASIYCSINYYFTHLYGMMPANTVASIRNYLEKADVSYGSISKESNGFEPWLDPLKDRRSTLFKTQGVNAFTNVCARLKSLLKAHVFHPALLTFDPEKENDETWFRDMEPSGITVECLLLRSKNETEKNNVDSLSPISPNIKDVNMCGSLQLDLEHTSLSRNNIIQDVMETYTSLCAFDPYLNVFPYRNSNIKTNEEAILLIALNFEAALRVSYTSNMLALKKQLLTSEIQEAKYEAIQTQMKEKELELLSCNTALSSLQRENSELIQESQKHRRATELSLQKLQQENKDLRLELNDSAFGHIEKDSLIESLKANINHISSQNEVLDREVKFNAQKIEKTEQLEQKLAKISIMLQNEPLDLQKKDAEMRNLESKIESMALNLEALTHDHQVVTKQLEYVYLIHIYRTVIYEADMLRHREAVSSKQKEQAEAMVSNLEKRLTDTTELHRHALQSYESKFTSLVKINQLLEAKLFLK